jgi:putative transposase
MPADGSSASPGSRLSRDCPRSVPTGGYVTERCRKRAESVSQASVAASWLYPRPMPRIARRDGLPDGIAHVTARGNRRADLFLVERDYRRYLELLEEALRRFGVECHAYCLMPNHVHLLLEGTQAAISKALQRAHGLYARWFNTTYRLDGHVFQGRFFAGGIESEPHLLELARYIANNPVRAGLCDGARDWPWSSFATLFKAVLRPLLRTTRWLLSQFGSDACKARAELSAFVAEGTWKPPPPRAPPAIV